VSDLLPHVVHHAVTQKSVLAASQSFGVIALVLLVALMIEREALRVAGVSRSRQIAFSICSASLVAVVALTIAARLAFVLR
jgi:hypothetical protein